MTQSSASHTDLWDVVLSIPLVFQHHRALFHQYSELLLKWNANMSLTSIVDEHEIAVKHFYDSLLPLVKPHITSLSCRIVDIGSGAGFPGLPLAIVLPEIHMTLIESRHKKCCFLLDVIEHLHLKNCEILNQRAEIAGRSDDLRESFDYAVIRALGDLRVIAEFGLPLLKIGGKLIAYKSGQIEPEIDAAKKSVRLLGGKIEELYSAQLPENHGSRTLIIIEKCSATPEKYPRRPGIPSKRPLK